MKKPHKHLNLLEHKEDRDDGGIVYSGRVATTLYQRNFNEIQVSMHYMCVFFSELKGL